MVAPRLYLIGEDVLHQARAHRVDALERLVHEKEFGMVMSEAAMATRLR